MKISGKNLELIARALDMALSDVHNDIATCPDVYQYEDTINELELEKKQIEKLRGRVLIALARETK